MTLMEELSGARMVQHDSMRGFVLAWFGGQGIHAYDDDGREISYWMLGGHENDADPEDVRADMAEEIESGDYLER